jgi:hypothetical protein
MSLYHGVNWNKANRKWISAIGPSKKGCRLHIGSYTSEEDAAQAYDVVAKERDYLVRKLNFPNE